MKRYFYTLALFIGLKLSPLLFWRSLQLAYLEDRGEWLKVKLEVTKMLQARATTKGAE